MKCLFSLPPLLLLCIWLSIAVDDLFSSDISSSGYFRNAVERSDSRNWRAVSERASNCHTVCVGALCCCYCLSERESRGATYNQLYGHYKEIPFDCARASSLFLLFFLFRHHFAVTAQPTVVVRSPVNCLVHVDWEKQTSPLMRMIISRTGPRIDGFTARLLDDEALLRVTSQR